MGRLLTAIVVVIACFAAGILIGKADALSIMQEKINECELNLPRTQHCVLTAVPAQGEKP